MKLAAIGESTEDLNKKIEIANCMRQDIASGLFPQAEIARMYGVTKVRIWAVRKQMMEAGWVPGQPLLASALIKPKAPATPYVPKYPGKSRAEINQALRDNPEHQAKMAALRQSPEYSAQMAKLGNAYWAEQTPEAKKQRMAAAHRARRKKPGTP